MTETANRAVVAPGARNQSSIAIKAVLRIAELWRLNDRSLGMILGGVSVPSIQRWRRQIREDGQIRGELTRDQLDRVSHVLGIYKTLHILFMDRAQADGWIHREINGAGLNGRSALDIMLGGGMSDLQSVRQFLDGWRG